MKRAGLAAVLALTLITGVAFSLHSQRGMPMPSPGIGRDGGRDGDRPGIPSPTRKMLKESFEQTQKDVAELSVLAEELKAETEKADADQLSLTIMKKAEAIEKLAERIKNRMKNL